MDLRRLHISDHLPYSSSSSPRRKVVSRFGLGMAFSAILLIILFYHVSFRASVLGSLWGGVNRNSTSPPFWSFSFQAASCFYSSCSNVTSPIHDELEPSAVRNVSDQNVSKDGQNRKFINSGGEGVTSNNSSVGISSEKEMNENVVGLEGGKAPEISPEFTRPEIDKNTNANAQVKVPEEAKEVAENVTGEGNSLGTKVPNTGSPNSLLGDCDIFDGRWVRDDSKPYYPPGSCPYIDRDFDCHLNKRPDDNYVKWRWMPHGCNIPSLNGSDFLERLRGKKMVFVGDSLNRNMWESLVCILRHSAPDKERVYEISGRTEFKKGGFYSFRFEDYSCSVDFVNSPFLVKESSFNGTNGTSETLRLDLMDETTSMYEDADILIFNTAHWWTHEKTSRGENYYQEGNHVHGRLKVLEAYKRAISTWARWVDEHINNGRTHVIFRGYSGVHFSGGQWNSGGQCHKESEPIFNESHLEKYPRKMKALEYVLQDMKTPVTYLNISRLTEFRKDAHPSIYRKEYKSIEEQIAAEEAQDCSHWCLPGVPDTWNELLYASLLKIAGRG